MSTGRKLNVGLGAIVESLPSLDAPQAYTASFVVVLVMAIYMQYPLLFAQLSPDAMGMYGRSVEMASGLHPYALMEDRALDKIGIVPNYMPLAYLSGAALVWVGHGGVGEWGYFFRLMSLISCLGTATVLFIIGLEKGHPLVGLFAAALWSFNRFTLDALRDGYPDIITVLFMVSSLYFFERKPRLSCLLLGLSIALKPFPLLLAPLYVIMLRHRVRMIQAAAMIFFVPAVVSLPFLLWNPTAFAKGILHSFVRAGVPDRGWEGSPLFDLFGSSGLLSRVPIMVMYLFLWRLAYHGRLSLYPTMLLSLVVFIAFNPFIYPRYLSWIMPLLPLTLLESPLKSQEEKPKRRRGNRA